MNLNKSNKSKLYWTKMWMYDFFMFLDEVSYAQQVCIYFINNTLKTAVLWNIITI